MLAARLTTMLIVCQELPWTTKAKDLLDTLQISAHTDYDSQSSLPNGILKSSLEFLSPVAEEQQGDIEETLNNAACNGRYFAYVHERMSTSEVLLRSIRHYSNQGHMDTQALRDLESDPMLAMILIEETRVHSVTEEGGEHLMEFLFDRLRNKTFVEGIVW